MVYQWLITGNFFIIVLISEFAQIFSLIISQGTFALPDNLCLCFSPRLLRVFSQSYLVDL